jgi:membrane-associated protease RseP (regulator of RpoE activity)
VFGKWLPADGVDVQLGSMANAAWVGIFVTMVNLMPIGQLDGGHVARVVLGDRHEVLSRRLHWLLPVIGAIAAAVMFLQARAIGKGTLDALAYAKYGAIPWLVWTAMLAVIRSRSGEYHPAVSDEPLSPLRKALAFGMLIVFVVIATPVPFRPYLA